MAAKNQYRPGEAETIEATAAAWLARRDKGFSADDEATFALWRFSDVRHAAAVAALEQAWDALDQLRDFRPEARAHPDPDMLAGPGGQRKITLFRREIAAAILTAAAAFAVVVWWIQPASNNPPARQAILHPGPERLTLDDGSVVELNTGAKIAVEFTPEVRGVRLVRGEAHFLVAKNPARPFVVTAEKIAVRAVGTAFSVSMGQRDLAVLVTEGRVLVDDTHRSAESPAKGGLTAARAEVTAGQRAVIRSEGRAFEVHDVTPTELERALSWQGMRLEFVELPLSDIVTEFNRYNRQKLVLGDREIASIVIAGNFRVNNVDGFVRLLASSFGISSSRQGDEIVLRKMLE